MRKENIPLILVFSLGLLQICFIGLKLGGVITWSWGMVLSPLWLPECLLITAGIAYITLWWDKIK